MPDFITLIENLSKIDRYHTSSIGNLNTAQSLAISAKISILKVMYLNNIIKHTIGQMCISKGQLISKGLFGVIVWTKNPIKLF